MQNNVLRVVYLLLGGILLPTTLFTMQQQESMKYKASGSSEQELSLRYEQAERERRVAREDIQAKEVIAREVVQGIIRQEEKRRLEPTQEKAREEVEKLRVEVERLRKEITEERRILHDSFQRLENRVWHIEDYLMCHLTQMTLATASCPAGVGSVTTHSHPDFTPSDVDHTTTHEEPNSCVIL